MEGKGVGSCQRPRTCSRIACQKLVPQRSFCHSIAWCACHILMRATYIILKGLVLLVRTNSHKCQLMQYLVTRTLRCFVVQKMRLLADDVKCGNVSVDHSSTVCGWSLHYPNIFNGPYPPTMWQ